MSLRIRLYKGFSGLVVGLAWVAGAGVMVMMMVTSLDVFCRLVYRPLTGTFDIVRITSAVSIACSIPYTTAIKGHVAIEYFFHKLSPRGRIWVDAIVRCLGILFFSLLSWHSILYGRSLRLSGQVSSTLQLPIFWVPYVIAFSCAVTVGVIFYNLLHPGREMIKP